MLLRFHYERALMRWRGTAVMALALAAALLLAARSWSTANLTRPDPTIESESRRLHLPQPLPICSQVLKMRRPVRTPPAMLSAPAVDFHQVEFVVAARNVVGRAASNTAVSSFLARAPPA